MEIKGVVKTVNERFFYQIVLLFLIVGFSANAQNYTSTSAGDWATAGNWTNTSGWGNAVPQNNQTTGTVNINHNLSYTGNMSPGSVTYNVNSGATWTINGNLNISGAGIINVYGSLIVTGTAAVLSSAKLNIYPGGKVTVIGVVTIGSNENLVVGTSATPPSYADAVFESNLVLSNSGDVVVNANGRLIVYGNVSATGGGTYFTINNGGQVYIHGNFTFSSSGTINNYNSSSPYGLYINGTVTNSGGTTTSNIGNYTNLQSGNTTFYNWGVAQENSPLNGYVPESSGYYWNGSNVSANPAAGGTGTWTTTNAWRSPNSTGSQATWSDGASNDAYFAGTGGVVTTAADRTFNSANFNVSGYTITSDGTTARNLTGNVVVAAGKSLSINASTVTANRTINVAGNISGGSGASLVMNANQTTGNTSRLGLTGSSSSVSLPITVQAGSNTTSYGLVVISGEGTNTQLTAAATMTNNTPYKTALGATTGNKLTVNSIVSGSADVVFAAGQTGGDGTVLLNAANTYSGSTTLSNGSAGVVKIGIANALPIATTLNFTTSSSGNFDLNGYNQKLAGLSGSTGGSIINNGTLASQLELNGSGTYSFGRTLSNGSSSISLLLSGSGIHTFTAGNTFSGDFSLNGPTFRIGASSAGSAGAPTSSSMGIGTVRLISGTLTSSSTSSRNIYNNYSLEGNMVLGDASNSGILIFNGAGTISGATRALTVNSQVTVSGVVSDGGNVYGIQKLGSGILLISAQNTFSGSFTLSAGTTQLSVSSTGSVGSITSGPLGTGTFYLSGGTLSSNGAGSRTVLNNVVFNANSTLGDATNVGALTMSGNFSVASNSLALNVQSSATISGVISDGGNAYTWIKDGSGTLTLTGANTYTGLTRINLGTLQLNRTGGATIPSTNNVEINGGILKISKNQTVNNLVLTSGELVVDAGITLTINGTFTGGGTITNNGTIVLVGPSTFPGANNTVSAMSNLQINRSGGVSLDKDLAISGTLTLTSGQLNVGNFTLTLDGNYFAGTVNNLVTTANSSLVLNCTGSGSSTLPNFTLLKNLTLGANSSSKTYSLNSNPTISGTMNFIAGTLAVNGNNLTYSGNSISRTSGFLDASYTNSTLTYTNTSALTLPSGLLSSSIYNLVINGTGGLNLGETTTVSNAITLTSGVLTIGANTLVMNGSTINRTSGSIDASNSGATISFGNSSLLTLPSSLFSFTVNNMTLNNARVKSAGDFTLNGILNLNNSNPDATNGLLDMVQSYGSYADVHSTNSTDSYNNLNSAVLTLGPNSTVTGIGDVTGKIRRNSFVDGVSYAFGNPNMRLTFQQNGGTLPTQMTVVATRGTEGNHVDKDGVSDYTPGTSDTLIGGAAVKRMHQILRTGGTSSVRFTVRFPYNESELNGNSESDLVTWDHHLPYGGMTPHEHGKTNQNTSENWVELSNHGLFYLAAEGDSTFTKYWMLSKKITKDTLWIGAATTSWTTTSNWSSGAVPSNWTKIIIDKALYNNELTLTGSQQAATMYIKSGAVVHGGSSTLTLNGGPAINGGSGTWVNDGYFDAGTSTVIINNPDATLSGSTKFNNLTINSGKKVTIQANTIDTIAGVLTNNGTLDATANDNKFVFAGANQHISNPNGIIAGFHDLEIAQSSGTLVADQNITVNGDLILTNGTFNPNAKTVTVKGNLISNASLNSSGKISMAGANSTISGSVVPEFYQFEIASGTTTLAKNVKIDSSLVINSGATLNAGANSIELTSSGTPFRNLGTFTPATSSVVYNSTGATIVAATTYNTLTAKGAGQKNLSGSTIANAIVVDNSILALNGTTLRFSGSGSNVSLLNGGKINATTGKLKFEHSGSAFSLDSAAFTGDIANLEINASQDLNLLNNITISDSLILTAGTIDVGNEYMTIGSSGKMITNGGLIASSNGGLIFKAQDLDVTALPNGNLNYLEINRPSGNVTINGDIKIIGNLKFTNGTLNLGTNKLTVSGDMVYSAGNIDASYGIVEFKNPADITIPNGLFSSSIKDLIANTSSKITLAQPVIVHNQLSLVSGEIVSSGSNMLEIGSGASQPGQVVWTDGIVSGPMKRWFAASTNASQESGIFPLGNRGLNKFAQVNFTSAPEGGYIVAEYKSGLPSGSYNLPLSYTESSNRYYIQNADEEGYWDITPYNSSGTAYGALDNTPYNLKLRINNPTSVQNGGILTNPPRLRLIRAKGSLSGHGSWQMAGTFAAVTELNSGVDYLVESSNVTGFSWFNAGGDNSNPLPVELLTFAANCNDYGVEVKWSTASENKSDYFEIQSSEDGVEWTNKAKVAAAGFSTQKLDYTFQDVDVLRASTRYYRLNQFDTDGNNKSYDPILVSCQGSALTVSSYPNPSGQNGFNLNIQSDKTEKWSMVVRDLNGNTIENQTFNSNSGVTNILLNKKWSKGMYIIQLVSEYGETFNLRQVVE